jgi:hypothetical protein
MTLTTGQKIFDPIPLIVPQTITQHLSLSIKQSNIERLHRGSETVG